MVVDLDRNIIRGIWQSSPHIVVGEGLLLQLVHGTKSEPLRLEWAADGSLKLGCTVITAAAIDLLIDEVLSRR